jgi:hypothetical protein
MAKRPSQDAWETARRTWESDPKQTFESIAQDMGVSRVAVSKRANRADDPWSRPQNMREIVDKAQRRADAREVAAKVSAEAAKVAVETRKESVAEEATELRANVLERHRADWSEHRRLFTLAEIKADFEAGKSAKISAEMLTLRQKGERAAYGIEDAAPANPMESMSIEELEAELNRLRKATAVA